MESTKEPAAVTAQRSPVPPRSDHISILEGHKLYVWGGCQCVDGQETLLPSDEIWLYDMENGVWSRRHMGGEVPPVLSQTCGAYLQGILYIFGGCDNNDYTNLMYFVDLLDEEYSWRKVTGTVGTKPSPRVRHSCWVYRNRLIYFGGYGPLRVDTAQEVNSSKSFMVDEASRATIGSEFFQFWGWNNEVQMFEPESATWTEPQTQGQPPEPRASHASATLGHKGYICGGLETQMIDIHCLDLVTWTWTQMLWHSADKGRDNDVVVFGGSQTFLFLMDSVAVLKSPSQSHCADVLVFQTQPYSLSRLCEDCIGKHIYSVQELALPAKLQKTIGKRISYFRANAQHIDASS
ncbi:kelch domain-containing protein 1-like isoform X3 [Ctenopharyngodon idella]|uniref:kelch domain-containing protein 1-like isoform X3 n=1 Tax=Ctenopharyngodon idella TaxID=7959 RepID=UPI00222FC744|nr:kelch domain-containing protein 1-like isoform X3 [Ctenopharyngodon idella]